ncbi:hypothetical protein [Actinocatenispora sera]|uniref:hypothetical protein n=1 Tax=Actinocatenispora sera TaxID=390989 RepID=UPI001FD40D62|nr:hypothetical protein [Actinocatenispora sera]
MTVPSAATSQGLLRVHCSPSSLVVLLIATTWPVAVSTTGEPDVPPITWHGSV